MPPSKLAEVETQLWQAYYAKDLQEISLIIPQFLQGFFDLSKDKAIEISPNLIKAAITFAGLSQDTTDETYRQKILPTLAAFYAKIKDYKILTSSAETLAIAELQW